MGNSSSRSVLRTILVAGICVGLLDILDAFVFFGLYGAAPIRILEHIASGLLGRAAFSGGWSTAMLGLALHFFIAITIAAVYILAARKIPALRERFVLFGMLYGVAAYFVMNSVVVPLSRVVPRPHYALGPFLNGIFGHALLVGLPIAFFARRAERLLPQ